MFVSIPLIRIIHTYLYLCVVHLVWPFCNQYKAQKLNQAALALIPFTVSTRYETNNSYAYVCRFFYFLFLNTFNFCYMLIKKK